MARPDNLPYRIRSFANRRNAIAGLLVTLFPLFVILAFYMSEGRVSRQAILFAIAATVAGVMHVFLLRVARRTPPPVRDRLIVALDLSEIISEHIYLGFRVEAMTDNIVVLVRIRMRALWFLLFLLIFVLVSPIVAVTSPGKISAMTGGDTIAALFLGVISFAVLSFFTIAGYGYERHVFQRAGNANESMTIHERGTFLASRVRLETTSKEAYFHDYYD